MITPVSQTIERTMVVRSAHEANLLELLGLAAFVALLAPKGCGLTSLLHGLKARYEARNRIGGPPGTLFLLIDVDPGLDQEPFLIDLRTRIVAQAARRGVRLPETEVDPYQALELLLRALPEHFPGVVVLSIDGLEHTDPNNLKRLLWLFRELHLEREDTRWQNPLSRLAVMPAGGRLLFDLSVGGEEDKLISPFNIARPYEIADLSAHEVGLLLKRVGQTAGLETPSIDAALPALQAWTGYHPALVKAVLVRCAELERPVTPEGIDESARSIADRDPTLRRMASALADDPETEAMARRILVEGFRPPDNLVLAETPVKALFWHGLLVARDGVLEPRCRLMSEAVGRWLEARGEAS